MLRKKSFYDIKYNRIFIIYQGAKMDTDLRNKIDRIWEYFWTGGITNPLSVIEQITYLLFIKGLDDNA